MKLEIIFCWCNRLKNPTYKVCNLMLKKSNNTDVLSNETKLRKRQLLPFLASFVTSLNCTWRIYWRKKGECSLNLNLGPHVTLHLCKYTQYISCGWVGSVGESTTKVHLWYHLEILHPQSFISHTHVIWSFDITKKFANLDRIKIELI